MPILDPATQYFLLINDDKDSVKQNAQAFFLKYLQIASRNMYRNFSTIDTSHQFKKDLQDSISLVNEVFGCNFSVEKDFKNQLIKDYYAYLFNKINWPNKIKVSKKYIGTYKICHHSISLLNTKLFQPSTLFSEYHSWYFSDTAIAILCIKSISNENLNEDNIQKNFQFIKLEIDLMAAAGLSLVLCYNGSIKTKDFLYQIIKDDQFSELHINIFDDDLLTDFLKFMKDYYITKQNNFKGFIYLYSYFYNEGSLNFPLMNIFEEKIPRTKIISYSLSPEIALKKVDIFNIKPFAHCKTGFNYKYLKIYLSYVPIYNKINNGKFPISNEISDICIGYIKTDDFLYENSSQKEIMFLDENSNSYNAVNFDDIHLVKPDLFVEDTLSLMQMEDNMHELIKEVQQKNEEKFDESTELQENYIHHISFKNYLKIIRRVSYAYTFFRRQKNKSFTLRNTQIYAVLEACESFFNKSKKNEKGVIYEIKTGEGKSCIVALIAAVLAIKKITAHIVSSNIELCLRDYKETLEFFNLLNLQPSVLLHKNELPSNQEISDKKYFPDKFFADEHFQNPSRMNFSICGIGSNDQADIIFSTFVNFECFYLNLLENYPGYIEKYFDKCGLLIDEADSILIDEITNGTIVSHEVNSNAKLILSKVYQNYKSNKDYKETYEELKKDPLCKDMDINDIKQMYAELQIIEDKDFCNGKKYSIESFSIKNSKRIENLLKKTVDFIGDLLDNPIDMAKEKAKEILFGRVEQEDDDEEEEDNNDELNTDKFITFKKIIPFDYDHKGILEPNKEFSGFIPQFISLKERSVKNLIFKNISISYLYVSHPIYAKLYKNICGFTGTAGNNEDIKIFKNQYELKVKSVPRHKPNLRVNFPTFACDNPFERNKLIANEILSFHEKSNPVLVIFQDFNEINSIINLLNKNGINKDEIIKFDGKTKDKNDKIIGEKGSIMLGTNICGRGTDIECTSEYPLHVIVTYYTCNTRVMEQAYGRTARNGQVGSCHCICLLQELYLNNFFTSQKIKKVVDEYEIKADLQREFIDYYKKTRSWIFEFEIDKLAYKSSEALNKLKELRSSKINVNRIIAYNFKYPIFMSYNTFLDIQSQKIFSIFNCPNCKYSWRIFQRYVREMILQSWSLMIKKFDQDNLFNQKNDEQIGSYKKQLNEKIVELVKSINVYLPETNTDMISTFANICNKVKEKYEDNVLKNLGPLRSCYKCFLPNSSKFTCIQLGFKPFSLLDGSGARITFGNIENTNYIKDPELSYERKTPDNKIDLLSITERVDDVVNKLFQKVSSLIGQKCFVKIFLRRTLAGCEFGICLDMPIIISSLENQLVLADKDPLLVATIYLWSIIPALAGILMFLLVYLAKVVKDCFESIVAFPEQAAKICSKKVIVYALENFLPKVGEFVYEKIIEYLTKLLNKEIQKMGNQIDDFVDFIDPKERKYAEEDKQAKKIFEFLRDMFLNGDGFYDNCSSLMGESLFNLPSLFDSVFGEVANGGNIIKVSILLILLIAAFLRNFYTNKKRIKEATNDAKEYDSTFDKKQADSELQSQKIKEIVNKHIAKDKDQNDIQLKKDIHDEEYKRQINNFISSSELNIDIKKKKKTKLQSKSKSEPLLNKNKLEFSISEVKPLNEDDPCYCIYLPTKIHCQKIYQNITKEFFDLVSFFSKQNHPVLCPFVGYVLNNNKSFLLFENKKGESMYTSYKGDNLLFNHQKQIVFIYGLACAMEILEKNNIVHRYLNRENILLENYFYPRLIGLELSNINDILKANSHQIAPELKNDLNRKSSKISVYSFGIFLKSFDIDIQNQKDFIENQYKASMENYNAGYLQEGVNRVREMQFNILKSNDFGILPFDDKIQSLIERCIDPDPNKRPTFSEICDMIEIEYSNFKFINQADIRKVYKEDKLPENVFNDYMNRLKPYRH